MVDKETWDAHFAEACPRYYCEYWTKPNKQAPKVDEDEPAVKKDVILATVWLKKKSALSAKRLFAANIKKIFVLNVSKISF